MTRLKPNSPLVRETAVCYRSNPDQPLVIELHPGFLVMKVKGKRSLKYSVSYDVLLERAQILEARALLSANTPAPKQIRVSRGRLTFNR